MRKYYQAVLTITAVVSLICFLFYRHEYNKLHYVLEVFNYFGQPMKGSFNCTSNVEKPTHLLSEPLPSWLRLNDDMFLYSSYNIDNKQIKTIAFGKINTSLKCAIYFADEPTIYSNVKLYPIKNSQESDTSKIGLNFQGYYLNCEFGGHLKPIGVKYLIESQDDQDVLLMAVKNSPTNLEGNDCGMCILPNENYLSSKEKLSFISVQNYIGVQYFLSYGYGTNSRFNAEMKKSMNKTFVYETVPWNFPFAKVKYSTMKSLIQADCLLRTRNIVKYAVTVQWKEFLVPENENIQNLMYVFHVSGIISNCYSLEVASFCSQHSVGKGVNASSLSIFKYTMSFPSVRVPPVLFCKPHEVINKVNPTITKTSSNIIKIYSYDNCPTLQDYKGDGVTNEYMLQFENIVANSILTFNASLV